MSQVIYDTTGRKLTNAELFRAMLMLNLSGGFGWICVMLTFLGMNTMTVFLNDWLKAPAYVIGFLLMLASILPLLQPLVAQVVRKINHRKRFIIIVNGISYFSVFVIAMVPLMGRSGLTLRMGLIITTVAILITMLGAQIVTLVSWTWIGDLVPEHKRSWFFGQGQSIANVMGAVGFFITAYAIDHLGGTKNPNVMSGAFMFAGLMGVISLFLLSRVPDVPAVHAQTTNVKQFVSMFLQPVRDRSFLVLLIALATVSFFMSITHPFIIIYARAGLIGGKNIGLGASLQYWSVISALVGIVGIAAGPFWGWLGDRLGSRFIMACGCLALSLYVLFFFASPDSYRVQLAIGMCIFGWFFPAYNIGWSTCAFNISSSQNRAAYMSVIPLAMMIGGPGAMLGGYIAEKFPVFAFNLPSGAPFAYIHLLAIITFIGMCVAIGIILNIPLHNQRKLSELLPIISDIRFFSNIVRAHVLAHTCKPSRMVWAMNGIKGASAVIVFKEIEDKIADAKCDVRCSALAALSRIDSAQAKELIAKIHDSREEDTFVAEMNVLCGECEKNISQILAVYSLKTSEALRKEIAVSMAHALEGDNRFYKILTRETVVPGSYFMKMTNGIRKTGRLIPSLKETIVECVMSIEEDFHSGNCDKGLKTCRALVKQVDQLNGSGSSTTAMILNQLFAVAEARTDKAQATLEMLLGVYITQCHIKKVSHRESAQAQVPAELYGRPKEQSVVPSK